MKWCTYFVQKSEKHLVYLEQDMQPAHLSSINHASLKQIIYKQKDNQTVNSKAASSAVLELGRKGLKMKWSRAWL